MKTDMVSTTWAECEKDAAELRHALQLAYQEISRLNVHLEVATDWIVQLNSEVRRLKGPLKTWSPETVPRITMDE